MKVLNVNCVFNQGSTGKIVKDIHTRLLATGNESIVCFGRQRGKIQKQPNVYKIATELEGDICHALNLYCGTLMYGGMFFSTLKLIKLIKKESPDIVHLHCINGYMVNIYILLWFLGKHSIKTVVTNHAEFFYTGNCGHAFDCMKWTKEPGCGNCLNSVGSTGSKYFDNSGKAWNFMKKAFATHSHNNLLFIAVSPWSKERLNLSPITKGFECKVVENGIDTNIFNKISDENSEDNYVLHVTAIFNINKGHIKGGWYIVELARRMPNVKFMIACGENQSMSVKLPSNVVVIGRVSNQNELAKYYSNAKLSIITSRRETFSMVVAESLSCGTPIVGFKAGGPESIALPEYSSFVSYGDIDALQVEVERMYNSNFDKQLISNKACVRYSADNMVNNCMSLYESLLSK